KPKRSPLLATLPLAIQSLCNPRARRILSHLVSSSCRLLLQRHPWRTTASIQRRRPSPPATAPAHLIVSFQPPSNHHKCWTIIDDISRPPGKPYPMLMVVCFRVIEKKLRKKMTLGMRFWLIIEQRKMKTNQDRKQRTKWMVQRGIWRSTMKTKGIRPLLSMR
ncbi:hypothetical protein U1Q18_000892, partial [Sarracenia purpurea var. burkii]